MLKLPNVAAFTTQQRYRPVFTVLQLNEIQNYKSPPNTQPGGLGLVNRDDDLVQLAQSIYVSECNLLESGYAQIIKQIKHRYGVCKRTIL